MKERKSALKYFVRLIKLEGLVEKRREFHGKYASMVKLRPGVVYNEANESAEYDELTHDFKFIRVVVDFGQMLCTEVVHKSRKSQLVIYDRLTSGSLVEQQAFYTQVNKDVEELVNIVAEQQLYSKYPCITDALVDIKKAISSYSSEFSEKGVVNAVAELKPTVEEVSFHYRCLKKGTLEEDKAMTRRYLGDLFIELKDKLELIAPDTSLDDFRVIFSGKAVKKPVMWLGANNQLRHFIRAIEHKLVPVGHKSLTRKWDTAAVCFINRKGEIFAAKQLQSTGTARERVHRGEEIKELGRLLR